MKIIYKILILSFVSSGLFACTGILDKAPDGNVSLKDIFDDNDKTAAFLNTCYMNIPEKGFSYGGQYTNLMTALSDEGYYTYQLQDYIVAKMYNGSATASSHPIRDVIGSGNPAGNNFYMVYMFQIRQCTLFLENIDNANVTLPADKRRWKAEALVLRAYFMSEMVKWFGGFAYEPHGYPNDYDYSTARKRSVWEIAQFIEQDCNQAIATDELPWRITDQSEQLRVTKALAWCLKSKMYLYAASPLHNFDNDRTRWQKAYEVNRDAVAALESNGYALKTDCLDPAAYPGPAGAYHELFSMPLSSADDRETIWHANNNMSIWQVSYIGGENLESSGSAGTCPTQEFVDAYEVTDANRTQAVPLLDLANPYSVTREPNYNQEALDLGYDPDDPYNCHRDPRMDVTVIKNGDVIRWHNNDVEVETFVGGANGINNTPERIEYTRTGYYFKKYIRPGTDNTNGYSAPPWKYFRLAEIKLNYAEAAAEAGQLAEAAAQVNDIRRRVGMPDLPANLSQAELILRIRQERRVELVYEEVRYFDLRRWLDEDDQNEALKSTFGTLTAMWITKNPDGTFSYERKSTLNNRSTNPRDLLLPIPYDEALNLRSLTKTNWQNPGW